MENYIDYKTEFYGFHPSEDFVTSLKHLLSELLEEIPSDAFTLVRIFKTPFLAKASIHIYSSTTDFNAEVSGSGNTELETSKLIEELFATIKRQLANWRLNRFKNDHNHGHQDSIAPTHSPR